MNTKTPVQEGYLLFRGYKVWYRIVGGPDAPGKRPLLCLHGGPGVGHDYLEPLEALAATGRRVVFYDQLGCGKSDHPHRPELWTMDLFVEEVATVRQALGLQEVHLLGQSWGGMLALQYQLGHPDGVVSLTLASSAASTAQWIAEANRLRSELPPAVQLALLKHEAAGTTGDPAYQEGMMLFYRRHVCRLDPWPECLNRSLAVMEQDPEVYFTLWGPSEFHATGGLKSWDVSNRLGEVRVPTLITSGRYDEATPAIAKTLLQGISGARWVLFENSSHQAHIEERELYLQTLDEFLGQAEALRK